jgi:hypothetical protein
MADLTAMLQAAAGAGGGINPREYFNTVPYTGNSSNPRGITGVGFQPDFLWIKGRNANRNHMLVDAVRGYGTSAMNTLGTETQNVEQSDASNAGQNVHYGNIQSLNSDGFTVSQGTGGNANNTNANTNTYVAWNWKANGAGVSNTDGTISSTVSVSTDSGFSIVTYTGNGTAGATVGHGLGVTPAMVIIKSRSLTGSTPSANWVVWHQSISAAIQTSTTIVLNSYTGAIYLNFDFGSSSYSIDAQINGLTQTYVAYCFAEVEGFSKFGSYTGNGSATGPSVTTDFEPTWLMIKRTDSTGDWIILDSARDATNPRDTFLEPNTSDGDATGNDVDFNATGFQLKSTSASINASGGTYIYACFA